MRVFVASAALLAALDGGHALAVEPTPLLRSDGSGRWSEPATWVGREIPGPGARVQIRSGHVVTFDARIDLPVRSIHVAGVLTFDPDRDTLLTVGLVKIQAGDDPGETGFTAEGHSGGHDPGPLRPALEVGAPLRPVAAGRTAVIRLAPVDGLDPEDCPAIVCCGGRMEFHGAALSRSWMKLKHPGAAGASVLTLAEPVVGWRPGDRVIVTATRRLTANGNAKLPTVRERPETEERTVRAVDGNRLTLDAPLANDHSGAGPYRGEVANLSRNVVVESAEPRGVRGHTMYHRLSTGSISYAEFRHLGKTGKLGKYSLHYHRAGDTMRGSSVVGASIWDSGNRWITIHGTNDLVVRDCVGYRSVGHGFFLEDGTEVDNVLDRNLAVQALAGDPLPGQMLAFDRNDGAGFWWANSRNAFTRNVAAECDGYGFRFDAPRTEGFDPVMPVRGSDGETRSVDVRTLPFLRFEGNEAHAQRRYGVNLGGGGGEGEFGGVGGVGPDSRHPLFVVRGLRVWDAHWALTPAAPGLLVDGLEIAYSDYGLWRPRFDRQAYRGLVVSRTHWSSYAETGSRPDPWAFPAPLTPLDDRPPVTVMTFFDGSRPGVLTVRGTAVDDGTVRAVRVNGREARPLAANFSEWEATLEGLRPGPNDIVAASEDAAGNRETTPHRATVSTR